MVFGAGEEKGWGPAPLKRVGDRFAAQVPHQKTHLRQEEVGPAPRGGGAQLATQKKDSDLLSSFLWSIGDSKSNHDLLYKPLQECFLLRIFVSDVARL